MDRFYVNLEAGAQPRGPLYHCGFHSPACPTGILLKGAGEGATHSRPPCIGHWSLARNPLANSGSLPGALAFLLHAWIPVCHENTGPQLSPFLSEDSLGGTIFHPTSSYQGPNIALTSGTSHELGQHESGACPGDLDSPESPSPGWVSIPLAPQPPAQLSSSEPAAQKSRLLQGPAHPHPRRPRRAYLSVQKRLALKFQGPELQLPRDRDACDVQGTSQPSHPGLPCSLRQTRLTEWRVHPPRGLADHQFLKGYGRAG